MTLEEILVHVAGFAVGRRVTKVMSLHRSLKSGAVAAKRNVLKRFERIEILRRKGKWKEGDRAFGLPKVKPAG